MASALEKAFKGVLKKSESQKVFSPWWSDAEDKLLYAVMILGKDRINSNSSNLISGPNLGIAENLSSSERLMNI